MAGISWPHIKEERGIAPAEGLLAAPCQSGYARPMRTRLEFAVLLAGWLLGFVSALRYVFVGA